LSIFSAVAALLSSLAFQPFASGFNAPVYVAAPRSEPGVVYVVEQGGEIWRLRNGARETTPFLDVHTLITAGGERGLLSVAFDPNYAKNRLFYVDYTDTNGDTRVMRYRSDGNHALPGTAKQLLFVKQPYPNHNGGQLEFGPDGYLYVGMGDGGSGGDPENRSQNLKSRLGKLLRYKAGRWQIAAYGLRNPWRFSFDRATGALWIGDVGQDTWEEVDRVPRGFGLTNFGWRVWEGRSRYTPDQTPNPLGKLVFPVWVYHHGDDGCSITGGYVYRGKAVPALRGRYVFGDYCSGKIWSYAGGKATQFASVPQLSSFGEDAAGELYATSLTGSVFKLSAA
jgi:glucose/arabinose dehydrogenase